MARTFQDRITPDAFVNFMGGDDSALTDAQKSYVGNEAAHWVAAEDLDREALKKFGHTPQPGVREVIGFPN